MRSTASQQETPKHSVSHRLGNMVILFCFFIILYIYLWLCWVFVAGAGFFSSCGEWGYSLVAVFGLFIVVAFLFVEYRLQGTQPSVAATYALSSCGSQALSTGSIVVVYGHGCSVACGTVLDQGSKLCLLHWQADSPPLSHQGSPGVNLFIIVFLIHH